MGELQHSKMNLIISKAESIKWLAESLGNTVLIKEMTDLVKMIDEEKEHLYTVRQHMHQLVNKL